jgi:hypothetical protein
MREVLCELRVFPWKSDYETVESELSLQQQESFGSVFANCK